MQSASNITNSNQYEDVTTKVTINEGNISTLQGELIVDGSNLLVGGDWLANYTSTTQGCTAVGYQAMENNVSGQFSTGIGTGALGALTTGPNNTAVGQSALTLSNGANDTALGTQAMRSTLTTFNNVGIGYLGGYNLTSGTDNVCVGPAAGGSLSTGTGNVFIGSNTGAYASDCTGAIVLGSRLNSTTAPNVSNTADNQLYIAPHVTSFNFSGLAAGTDSTGTILEYDSTGNIIPSAGTYNTVSKIDTELSSLSSSVSTNTSDISSLTTQVSTNTTNIADLQNSVSLTGLFVPIFSSESNCKATATNSGYNYYGQRFLNCYMLFAINVSSRPTSLSVTVGSFPSTFSSTVTPNVVLSVSSPSPIYHSATWDLSSSTQTLSLTFTASLAQVGYIISNGTYNVSLNVWGLVDSPP